MHFNGISFLCFVILQQNRDVFDKFVIAQSCWRDISQKFQKKKRPYLGIKKVCNVYETVCSPSTKCLTKYCRIKCQDFSLSYKNRAVGTFENSERPIVIDCLSLLLFVPYGCKIWWGHCIRLRGRKMCYKNSKIAVSCTKYAACRHYLRQLQYPIL